MNLDGKSSLLNITIYSNYNGDNLILNLTICCELSLVDMFRGFE